MFCIRSLTSRGATRALFAPPRLEPSNKAIAHDGAFADDVAVVLDAACTGSAGADTGMLMTPTFEHTCILM